ncbi:ABC transporter substrate-binding protein [Thaumasiovibrio subtropicus]|uniref:ABC transporter substrate-binding protein n=1 Tax=Thaumasiovibrio subtropicus TaxID=1891207 RepID=UPI000B361626|nr:ABC transporter substrate-binding protein [Thaumasiovibrio subtropicus]
MKKNVVALSIAMCLATPALAAEYSEAPQLTKLVEAGQLPEVSDRLPQEPLVVTPFDSVGKYGGTLNLLGRAPDNVHRIRIIAYDNLFNFNEKYNEVVPNLATGFTANEENTVFTLSLRKGVKWSDGHPFTADDIVFYINEVIGDPDHAGNRPLFISSPDAAKATAVDAHTVKIELKEPNGLFIRQLATIDGASFATYPKHYCSQFYPQYNKNLDAEAEAAGFSTWRQYSMTKCRSAYFIEHYTNVDRPVLTAWKVKTPPGPNTPIAEFERNPFYWQVDTEGNQLPYLDSVRWRFSEDSEEMVLRAAAGETDFQARHIGGPSHRPMLIANEEKGGYTYHFRPTTLMNSMVLGLNQTTSDKVKAELFAQKDFRVALSHGIDREDISETVYSGVVEPYQAAPIESSAFYDEEMASQYTDYDVETANKLLDGLGLEKRDSAGYRLMKDGRRLRIEALTTTADLGGVSDSLELVKNQWKEIGVFLDIRVVETNYLTSLRITNDFELIPMPGDGGVGIIDEARSYLPYSPESTWGLGYYNWAQDPNHEYAVEPPAHVKRQIELFEKVRNTADQAEQQRLMKEIMAIAKEQFYVIGTVSSLEEGVVINNKIRNVPHDMPQSYTFPTPGPMRLGQLWKEQ